MVVRVHSRRPWPIAVSLAGALLAGGCAARHHARVDVGGRSLHLDVAGEGLPVVVLESGLGGTVDAWSEVFPAVSRCTRVVAYDRAGLGRSDRAPGPLTAGRSVEDLKTLLERAGVRPPYVLVGHSLGGLIVRLFAQRYPDVVAGLVLVDATHEDYPAREALLRARPDPRRFQTTLLLQRDAVRQEYEAFPQSAEEIRAAPPMPAIPIVVVSSGRFEGSVEVRQLWNDFQRDLAGRWPWAEHRIAAASGHLIPYEDPDSVIAAIRDVVAEARRRLTAPPTPRSPGRP